MILIHGYGGGEDALPMAVLKDGNMNEMKYVINLLHDSN